MNFSALGTEQVNPRSVCLDELSPLEAAQLMNDMDHTVADAVAEALPKIAQAVEVIAKRLKAGGRLVYAGAGTSGRLGVLDASECPPTFGADPEMVVGLIAGGDRALRFAIEGAEDRGALGRKDMDAISLCKRDVLVSISASGSAPYCIGALQRAREVGAYAIALCCNRNAAVSAHSDLCIETPTGPEILSGSTRLMAGTATKMVLNMLSTLSMVQLGKVYRNLMVDMRPSNEKLSDRAVRIVQSALEPCGQDEARRLLEKAEGNTKAAIVCGLTGASLEAALASLKAHDGYVRKAVEALTQ